MAILFFTFVFGVLELARAMYVINTLQEVTRRAAAEAANTDFSDAAALRRVRQKAIFRSSSGQLALADPVSDDEIRIDYLSVARDIDGNLTMNRIATLPSCPARNRLNCVTDPYSASCIRFVRVRVCQSGEGETCTPVRYRMVFPLISLPIDLPRASTIVTAETLGFTPGMGPCP